MKKIIFTALLASSLAIVEAQSFNVGDQVVNVGIGFGSTLYGSGYSTTIPPLSVSYEKGFKDGILDKGVISWGGYLGLAGSKYSFMSYEWKYTNIIIGARGTFHYPIIDDKKIDTYAGLMIGFNYVSVSVPSAFTGGYSAMASGLGYSIYIGGRYYFTDMLSGMLELGYGISYVNLGVGIKL